MKKYLFANSYFQRIKLAQNDGSSELQPQEKVFYKIREISNNLSDNQKIIVSRKPFENFKSVTQIKAGYKPIGLWYACGSSWIRWLINERYLPGIIDFPNDNFFSGAAFIYEIEIDKSNMITISNESEFEDFEKRFSISRGGLYDQVIDWPRIAQQYSGIESCPYMWEKRGTSFWYYSWAVASGCIWDENAFKSIKLLAVRANKKQWELNKETWPHRKGELDFTRYNEDEDEDY